MDAAACIGCGACVAACPNASAMLFTAAKVSQLALLPQGQPERYIRVRKMVAAMDEAGFGNCTNHGECEAACPKGIKLDVIARMNRDFLKATLMGAEESTGGGRPRAPASSRDGSGPREARPPIRPSGRARGEPAPRTPAGPAAPHHRVDAEDHDPGVPLVRRRGQELERAARLAQREMDGRRLVR